jgi:hypothetical protein
MAYEVDAVGQRIRRGRTMNAKRAIAAGCAVIFFLFALSACSAAAREAQIYKAKQKAWLAELTEKAPKSDEETETSSSNEEALASIQDTIKSVEECAGILTLMANEPAPAGYEEYSGKIKEAAEEMKLGSSLMAEAFANGWEGLQLLSLTQGLSHTKAAWELVTEATKLLNSK